MDTSEKFLKESGIRPTSTRVLIWEKLNEVPFAFSLTDIEDLIPDIDRSTIFRTVVVFEEHHLLHSIDDGSGAQKYCVAMFYILAITCCVSFLRHWGKIGFVVGIYQDAIVNNLLKKEVNEDESL